MSFLGEVAQPTAHIPNRNHAWSKEGNLSAKSKALASGPFRAETQQQQTHWKGPFERSPEVVASIAQRPVTAEDLTYTGEFTFGDRVSDDVFHETKKFIRKARHRRPVSPTKAPLPEGELVGGADGADARDTIAVAQSTLEPASTSSRRSAPEQGQISVTTDELPDVQNSDFSRAAGEGARYHEGRAQPAGSDQDATGADTTVPQVFDYAAQFEMPPDPPSAPCAYLGKHLRRNSPRKVTRQQAWEDEEEKELGDLALGSGSSAIHLAGRRKKRYNKNIDVQAQILTALVTGDQVSYLTMESEFRKAQAQTAAANPWALTMNQKGASMVGDTRGWTRPDSKPDSEAQLQSETRNQAGMLSPKKRPHRRWFGYGPAPPVEPEPEREPEPEPEFVPASFGLHYPEGLPHPEPELEAVLETEPEPYRSPIADLPTGSYWLDNPVRKDPPKCTCHPTKGSSGCRLHDPNYKHPSKGLQTPPSWMFKGNTALNEEMTKIKDEYSTYVASGGIVKQAEKKRNAFLMRSFLMLRARLSFSANRHRGTFSSKEMTPGELELASSRVRCSYCGTVQKPYKEKRGRDYLIDAEGNKIQLPRPEGLDWVQREIINDCGQIGPWDAPAPRPPAGDIGEVSDLLSESEDDEEALLDDPLALTIIGGAPPQKKPVLRATNGKQGDKPCLGLLQRVTLCPRHETACAERLDEQAVSTVLLKSALWRTLREADRERRAHQLRHVIAIGKMSKQGAEFAYKYTKLGAQALVTVAKKELAKIKKKRAARQVAYAQRQQQAVNEQQDEVKVGEALHVQATALVAASTGEGVRDLRTGKKLVW